MGALPAERVREPLRLLLTTFDIYAAGQIAEPWCHWLVWVPLVSSALMIVIGLGNMARYRRRARLARTAFSRELAKAGDSYVKGKVAFARETDAAVRVEIDQKGREWQHKGNWNHEWKEYERRVHAEPFYVVQGDGSRVRVEPGTAVFLVDCVDRSIPRGELERTVIAELSQGEEVLVEGEIREDFDPEGPTRAAYRESSFGLVQRPLGTAPMLISAQPMHARFEERGRAWRRFTLFGLAGLLMVGLFSVGYLSRLGSERKIATVVKKDGRNDSKGMKYYLSYDAGGDECEEQIRSGDYYRIRKGSQVIYREAGMWSSLGSQDSTDITAILMSSLLWLFCVVAGIGWLRRPWYERALKTGHKGRISAHSGVERRV